MCSSESAPSQFAPPLAARSGSPPQARLTPACAQFAKRFVATRNETCLNRLTELFRSCRESLPDASSAPAAALAPFCEYLEKTRWKQLGRAPWAPSQAREVLTDRIQLRLDTRRPKTTHPSAPLPVCITGRLMPMSCVYLGVRSSRFGYSG